MAGQWLQWQVLNGLKKLYIMCKKLDILNYICAKSYAGNLKLCSLSAGLQPQLSCAENSAIRVVHTRKRADN